MLSLWLSKYSGDCMKLELILLRIADYKIIAHASCAKHYLDFAQREISHHSEECGKRSGVAAPKRLLI